MQNCFGLPPWSLGLKISSPFSGLQITHHTDRSSDDEKASAIRPRLGSFPWPRLFSTNRAFNRQKDARAGLEDLLWAVWEKGGLELVNRVIDAIADKTDPWQRMETACVAHTTGLLDWRRANQALFIMPPGHYPDGIKARVIALRDDLQAYIENRSVTLMHAAYLGQSEEAPVEVPLDLAAAAADGLEATL